MSVTKSQLGLHMIPQSLRSYYVIDKTDLQVVCGPLTTETLAEEALMRINKRYQLNGNSPFVIVSTSNALHSNNQNTDGIDSAITQH